MNRSSLFRAFSAACAAVVLAAGCASTAPGTPPGPSMAARLSAEDRVFALQAAGGGLYEVEAGRLAVARATRPEVRGYGQMLVDHHAAANAELAALLQSRGIAPPAVVPPQFVSKLSRMSGAAGPAFDHYFVRIAGVEDHRLQVTLFENAARDVRDPELKAWFVRTLPALRSHLTGAHALAGPPAG